MYLGFEAKNKRHRIVFTIFTIGVEENIKDLSQSWGPNHTSPKIPILIFPFLFF